MHRLSRYLVALLVGGAVTAAVALLAPPSDRSPVLLAGIAQLYAVGTALALRYPEALRGVDGPNTVGAAFAGVSTFGCMSLLNGVGDSLHFGALVLGFGLVWFGLICGFAFGRERNA